MAWNPELYNQFKEERYQPFHDLVGHIYPRQGMNIIDLGCGTGELTQLLAEKFSPHKITGIDTSAEMLAKAPRTGRIAFVNRSVEAQLEREEHWDLIFANASLQWVDDHAVLFPKIISKLHSGGQLAVQMPSQQENRLNQVLDTLVRESPFREALQGWRRDSPVLGLDAYTQLFFQQGAQDVVIYQKVYPLLVPAADRLYDFIAGSALVPYMERLENQLQDLLEAAFRERIRKQFNGTPVVYPFKRLILYGRF
ncbi:methyltransferase domain-containing protein [Flavihumibacter petaseus]|uniref:Trans-aconitate 2-methyltransferase n=1 Tax=Flavihumibacter petaseus NBRC 106054 TaxID=1220578 RepID=A0A0E9N1X1_9BACT|nr:methyltransferase domain-containing protein [Flavihumibacter petaseus]GAO43849.1 trans-aconitate 2-methyltransferase [Flavihumibacter petaseus NBRC 106054]